MNIFSLAYLAFVFTIVTCNEETEESVLHDSLTSQDSILDIYHESMISEQLHTVTKEKTVYVTLNPTTIYVTITEGPESTPSSAGHISTVTNSLNEVETSTWINSIKESTGTAEITHDSITIVTKTEIEYVSSIKIIKPVLEGERSNTEAKTSINDPLFVNISTSSAINFQPITTTIGELNLLLGDRPNFDKETFERESIRLFPTTSLDTEEFETKTTSTNAVVKAPIQSTDVTVTQDFGNDTLMKNGETWAFDPFDGLISTSTSAFKSQEVPTAIPLPTHSFNSTHNSTIFNNQTGLEHLLENFRPYTDLPTADYTLINSGNRLSSWVINSIMAITVLIL